MVNERLKEIYAFDVSKLWARFNSYTVERDSWIPFILSNFLEWYFTAKMLQNFNLRSLVLIASSWFDHKYESFISNFELKRLLFAILTPTLAVWALHVHTALSPILLETLFLDQLYVISLLSLYSFVHPFLKSKFMWQNFLTPKKFHFRSPIL